MVTKTQYKVRAFLLLIPFFIVLVALFMPWYPGSKGGKINGLDYFDNFFNEVSKGSSFSEEAQAKLMKTAEGLSDPAFKSAIKMKGDKKAKYSPEDAAQTAAKLLTVAGLQATAEGDKVTMAGDLGVLAKTVIQDSVAMYNNKGDVLQGKYGLEPKQALYTWHQVMDGLGKSLTKAEKFEAAKTLQNFMTKAIEPAYNYYGVKVTPVKEEMIFLAFALIFYVVYTMWYGFGILYLFEGFGVVIGH
ncbi:MAG: hypothetical protein LBH14_06890 [Desulfobulbaceae bacterium]|jgi:hypothetical protein|nr:hypothetical protein [Desulfobulbaceae bacterium]